MSCSKAAGISSCSSKPNQSFASAKGGTNCSSSSFCSTDSSSLGPRAIVTRSWKSRFLSHASRLTPACNGDGACNGEAAPGRGGAGARLRAPAVGTPHGPSATANGAGAAGVVGIGGTDATAGAGGMSAESLVAGDTSSTHTPSGKGIGGAGAASSGCGGSTCRGASLLPERITGGSRCNPAVTTCPESPGSSRPGGPGVRPAGARPRGVHPGAWPLIGHSGAAVPAPGGLIGGAGTGILGGGGAKGIVTGVASGASSATVTEGSNAEEVTTAVAAALSTLAFI